MTEVMPVFAFARRRDIEMEAGLILAGQLIVGVPKQQATKKKHKGRIMAIIERLVTAAQSGQMPDNAVIYGWPGNARPANAVDVHNDAVMKAWAERMTIIALKIDPRSHGDLVIDSDLRRQMGLLFMTFGKQGGSHVAQEAVPQSETAAGEEQDRGRARELEAAGAQGARER